MKRKTPSKRRLILPYRDFILQVNSFCWQTSTDEELKACLQNNPKGNTAKTYSLLKEILYRCKGLRLFDTQIAAAYGMEQGKIVQLPTGEGKTLSAVMAAASLALGGGHVHIVVFNDYLAERDFEENKEIFQFCGLSLGRILSRSSIWERKTAYLCDVIYLTVKEAGFDFLKNFMVCRQEDFLQQNLEIALIDEADSILIDEAKNPLVLAGEVSEKIQPLEKVKEVINSLAPDHIGINGEEKQVWLTEGGISYIERLLKIENLYDSSNNTLLSLLHAMLEAKLFYQRDRDYVVREGQICVVEDSTGRIAENRKFPDLIHGAIEAKEGLRAGAEAMIFHRIPLQFFLRQYERLCGMTGTAWPSRKEIRSMYDLEVVRISSHLPCIRRDHEDVLVSTNEELSKMVTNKIIAIHEKGQPILLGTQSVAESEEYARLLREKGLPCCVLNAKQDKEEATLIAHGGEPYRITISTNMAGRGVDIKLGGGVTERRDFVKNAGGLFVLSTGINRSLRMDDQLRGRAGRQGDPGESQFFISLQQDLIKEYFQGKQKNSPKKIRQIQSAMEGQDAQCRYILEKYSVILEKHRQIITAYRENVLKNMEQVHFVEEKAPALYARCVAAAGKKGFLRAQQQLLLFYINQHWADYLLTMEAVRDGIHLSIIGREEPIHVYDKFAAKAFSEMEADIAGDVLAKLETCRITENGIDREEEGLPEVTYTWSYLIDESKSQFAKLPKLLKGLSSK